MNNFFASTSELLEKSNVLYEFVDLFSNYENTARDYGAGTLLSMNEVHMLAAIDRNPGILLSELAIEKHRSKSFVSQVVSKLEKTKYILKVPDPENNKKKRLFVTKEGKKICVAHLKFDENMLTKTYNYLLRDCSPEEIASFYKVMTTYNNIMKAAAKKRRKNT